MTNTMIELGDAPLCVIFIVRSSLAVRRKSGLPSVDNSTGIGKKRQDRSIGPEAARFTLELAEPGECMQS